MRNASRALQPHAPGSDPLMPWRDAVALIEQGKVDEAAALIRAQVNPNAMPPRSALPVRVYLDLGDRLKAWVDWSMDRTST